MNNRPRPISISKRSYYTSNHCHWNKISFYFISSCQDISLLLVYGSFLVHHINAIACRNQIYKVNDHKESIDEWVKGNDQKWKIVHNRSEISEKKKNVGWFCQYTSYFFIPHNFWPKQDFWNFRVKCEMSKLDSDVGAPPPIH